MNRSLPSGDKNAFDMIDPALLSYYKFGRDEKQPELAGE
jgi:hypothetical protein